MIVHHSSSMAVGKQAGIRAGIVSAPLKFKSPRLYIAYLRLTVFVLLLNFLRLRMVGHLLRFHIFYYAVKRRWRIYQIRKSLKRIRERRPDLFPL